MNGDDPFRGPRGWPPNAPAHVLAQRRGGAGARAGGGPFAEAGLPLPPSATPAGQLLEFPPEYFPTAGATPFMVQGSTTGLAAGTQVTLGGFTLPASELGVVRSISLGVGNITPASNVIFSVQINGSAVPAYGEIFFPPQPAAFAAFSFGPEETRVWVPQGALVELIVRVPLGGGGPFDATGTLHGWHWGTA